MTHNQKKDLTDRLRLEALDEVEIALNMRRDDAKFLPQRKAYSYDEHMQAIKIHSDLLAIEPDNTQARLKRAYIYSVIGDYNNSIKDYSTLLSIQPDNRNALFYRGCDYIKIGENELAVEDFSAALTIEPDDLLSQFFRGIEYANRCLYDEAIADFKAILKRRRKWARKEIGM